MPSGDYYLWIDGQTYSHSGQYALEVRDQLPGETCSTAETIGYDSCVEGSTENYLNDHQCNPGHNGRDRVYRLDLPTEKHLSIVGEADYEADWTITSDCGGAADILCVDAWGIHTDPSCGNIDSHVEGFINWNETLGPGTYYIWVDGENAAQTGSFALEVSEQLPGETCESAETISLGDCVTGNTMNYGDEHDCNGGHEGADRVYHLELIQETFVQIIGEADYNADWSISTTCGAAADILCADQYGDHLDPGCGDIVNSGSDYINWSGNLETGDYFIWVDGLGQSHKGNYALEIRHTSPTPTETPTPTVSPTSTPTYTPTPEPTPTITFTPPLTPSDTPAPTYTPTPAPPPMTVWADDDWTGASPGQIVDGHIFGYDAFDNINDALSHVAFSGTIIVNPGVYNETVHFASGFTNDELTLTGDAYDLPEVTAGVRFDNTGPIDSLTIEHFIFTGDAGSNKIIQMDNAGAVSGFTMNDCILDGENVAGRHGLYGNKFSESLAVTNCEFRNILGAAVMDTDVEAPGLEGESELALTEITFTGNYIHHCNGTTALRGNYGDLTDILDVQDNIWSYIGGNQGEPGSHFCALEINHALTAYVAYNSVDNVIQGSGGEGQGFRFWDVLNLTCICNDVEDNAEGVFIFGGGGIYGGPYDIPGGYMAYNNVRNNSVYGLKVDSNASGDPFRADFNYWGASDGPSGEATGNGDEIYGQTFTNPG